MNYLVLRDCFVGGSYYVKGTVCDIPDNVEKSPKNFKPLDGNGDINLNKPAISNEPKTLYDIAQMKPNIIGQEDTIHWQPEEPEMPESPKDFEEFIENTEGGVDDEPPLYVSDKPKRGRPKKR